MKSALTAGPRCAERGCIAAEDSRRGAVPDRGRATLAPMPPSCRRPPPAPHRPDRVTPDPVAFHLGSIPVYWYGVCYAVGLGGDLRRDHPRGAPPRPRSPGWWTTGSSSSAVAALIGGRLYHVIDQWQLYKDDLVKIVTPPYTGLGVYGGILTGTIALVVVLRVWKQSFWRWADVIAPGLFVMQAIGRWGNFFNQELYGPPTTLPWGITIDCAHRVAALPVLGLPARDDRLPAAVPVRVGQRHRWARSRCSGSRAAGAPHAPRRPAPHLVHLVRGRAVRARDAAHRQLDLLRCPDGDGRLGGLIVGSLAVLAIRHRPGAADGDRWGDPPEPGWDRAEGVGDDEMRVDDEGSTGTTGLTGTMGRKPPRWRGRPPRSGRSRPGPPDGGRELGRRRGA